MTDRRSKAPSPPARSQEHRHVIVSQRLVAVNAVSSLVAKLLNATVILWMYQYLLARISPEEFAVYPVVTALMTFAPLFFSVFTGGVSRHIVEACALGEKRRAATIISSISPLLAAAGLAFLAIGLTASLFIDKITTIDPSMVGEARIMLSLLVANFALNTVFVPFTTGFNVTQRFVELNVIGVFRDLLRIALLVALLVGVSPSVLWVVVAGVIADQMHMVVVVLRSRQLLPEARFIARLFSWATAREILSFGLWTTVGQLANVIIMSAGILILNAFGSALDVTIYYLGVTFYRQIQQLISLAAGPLLPALTAMHSLSDSARLARTALRGGRYGLWVSLIVACPLAIYSREFVVLYLGDGFAPAAAVLSLFMCTFFFTRPTTLLPMTAMATAQVRPYNLGAFVTALAMLLSMLYLVGVERMGALGVALSFLIVTAIAQLVYFWPLLLALTETPLAIFASAVLVKGVSPAVVGSLAWAALGLISTPDTWASLIALSGVGAVAYLATVLAFCLDTGDKRMVRHMTSKVFG
jgi:O-antigen/teichoic acid export membrane protein